MPDLRYHLVSLISVFLALAIGILLGTAMADRGVISDRLQAQITDVQDRFEAQQKDMARRDEEINRLRQKTTQEQDLAERMSQVVITNRLRNEKVALVTGPWADDDVVGAVENVLSQAGVEFTSNTQLDAPQTAEITSPETTGETTVQSDDIYRDQTREVLRGSEDAGQPRFVVFVGGGMVPPDAPPGALRIVTSSERTMLESWRGSGLNVVGAESSTTRRSEIELFQDIPIPSVDNADQPAGQAALILVIADDLEGSYGTKSTASDIFPPAAT